MLQAIVKNDVYFTGILQPKKENTAKGVQPMDTGLKLFPKELILQARQEMAVRRARFHPTPLDQRKTKQRMEGTEVVFSDALLHGLARCGYCGWKLGLGVQRMASGTYGYYVCRHRYRGDNKCKQSSLSVKKLDLSLIHI